MDVSLADGNKLAVVALMLAWREPPFGIRARIYQCPIAAVKLLWDILATQNAGTVRRSVPLLICVLTKTSRTICIPMSNPSRSPDRYTGELRRLHALVPAAWQARIELNVSGIAQRDPIQCVDLVSDCAWLQIDLRQWESLQREWRDLLLWHQVALLQAGAVSGKRGWEQTVVLFGLGSGLGELWLRDGSLLWIALGALGVAGYRIYRRSRRSSGLAAAMAADAGAISLAVQSGYPASVARRSLADVLERLHQQAANSQRRDRYFARWQALQSPVQTYSSASPGR